MAPLSPYELSVRRAKNWKESVKSLWRTQLTILILGIVGICTLLLAFIVGINLESLAITMFMSFIGYALFFVVYIFQWIFAVKVKNWATFAPAADQDNIERVGTTMIIALVLGIVEGFASAIGQFAPDLDSIIQIIASIATLIVLVIQIVAFAKLSGSSTLPALAKKGVNSMLIYYIVCIASVVVGVIPVVYGIMTMYSESIFGGPVLGDTMFILGMSVIFIGVLTSMFFYYRAWWLISKSELEVLPEDATQSVDPIANYYAQSTKIEQ